MKEECKVSVIIPIYNTEKYLRECLDSILKQTLKDIEVICVDDGSEDRSPGILKEYGADERFFILTQDHKGVSAARNAGIEKAGGRYIYFMDSDDILMPQALEHLYLRAEKDSLDITLFNGRAKAETSEFSGTVVEQNTLMNRISHYRDVYSGVDMMNALYSNGEYWMTVWLQLYRRDFCREHNLRFMEGIIHEDNLFTYVSILSADRCGYLDEILYIKRVRPESITTVRTSFDNVSGYFACYLEMQDYLIKNSRRIKGGAAEAILDKMLEEARRLWGLLDYGEKVRYLELPYEQQLLFRAIIEDHNKGPGMMGACGTDVPGPYETGAEGEHGLCSAQNITRRKPVFIKTILGKLKRLCHKLLPSSRYNVAWSYQHLTAQLQVQQQLVNYVMSSTLRLEQELKQYVRQYENDRHADNQDISDSFNTFRTDLLEQREDLGNLRKAFEENRKTLQENRNALQENMDAVWKEFDRLKQSDREGMEALWKAFDKGRIEDRESIKDLWQAFEEMKRSERADRDVFWTEYKKMQFNTTCALNDLKYDMNWVFSHEILNRPRHNLTDGSDGARISVIIPVYNMESTLERCIESIRRQSIKDVEIICIDDGSTDGSFTVLEQLQNKDWRIKIFTQKNEGAGSARNTGLNKAAGDYITFMDADDMYPTPYSLEILYRTALDSSADICGGSACFIKADREQVHWIDDIDYAFRRFGWIPYEELQQDYYFQRFIYKRSFLEEKGIRFPGYKLYQDVLFMLAAMTEAGGCFVTPAVIYRYNIGDNKNMFTADKGMEMLKAITEELSVSAQKGYDILHYRILERLPWFLEWIRPYEDKEEMKQIKGYLQGLMKAVDWELIAGRDRPYALELINGLLQGE